MAFCGNCGTQTDDNARICPNCGSAIGAAAPQMQMQQAARAPKAPMSAATKKKLIIGLSAGAAAIVTIIVLIVVLVNRPKTFSVKDAIILSPKGYDTIGRLDVRTDHELIEINLRSAKKDLRDNALYEIVNTMKITPSATEKLSNGQEITVKVTVNEQLLSSNKLRLAEDEWTYTVEGLDPVTTVDPFENVTVEFTGISPYLQASIKRTDSSGVHGAINYEADKESGLAIGDTVKVTADYGWYDEASFLENYGARLSTTEKTYTVGEADAYVSAVADLDETTLAAMQKEAQDIINAYIPNIANADWVKHEDLVYEGCFVLSGKESFYSEQNQVWLVYSSVFSANEEADKADWWLLMEEPATNYFPIAFYDVVKYRDGTIGWDSRSRSVEGYKTGVGTYGHQNWSEYARIDGYASSADMMTDLIRKNTDYYNYELGEDIADLF